MLGRASSTSLAPTHYNLADEKNHTLTRKEGGREKKKSCVSADYLLSGRRCVLCRLPACGPARILSDGENPNLLHAEGIDRVWLMRRCKHNASFKRVAEREEDAETGRDQTRARNTHTRTHQLTHTS